MRIEMEISDSVAIAMVRQIQREMARNERQTKVAEKRFEKAKREYDWASEEKFYCEGVASRLAYQLDEITARFGEAFVARALEGNR